MAKIRIGVSGWRYPPWRGTFYPKGLPQTQELAHASHVFTTLEINGTFYSLQRPESFTRWREATPPHFRFAVKGSRYLTHMLKLNEPRTPLANFFASGVLALADRLGPILWQFPAAFRGDTQAQLDRFVRFLDILPTTTAAAARLARHHDRRVRGRSLIPRGGSRRIRHAIELRHPSCLQPRWIDALRQRNFALVFSHTQDRWPYVEELTAGFAYIRLHGPAELYASDYADTLTHWAQRVRLWHEGKSPRDAHTVTSRAPPPRKQRDVYVYFDNTDKVHAPTNAVTLARSLGLQ